MTLVLSGSLEELQMKTAAVIDAIETREASGVDLYHPDTRWLWISTTGLPCPRCAEHVGKTFRGDAIRGFLPFHRILGPGEIHPEYHKVLGWHTPCYCRLILQNGVEVFEQQLHADKERAAA